EGLLLRRPERVAIGTRSPDRRIPLLTLLDEWLDIDETKVLLFEIGERLPELLPVDSEHHLVRVGTLAPDARKPAFPLVEERVDVDQTKVLCRELLRLLRQRSTIRHDDELE